MNRKLIISQTDIKAYRPMADLPPGKIEAFISEAQQQDLRALMNDALYTEFLTNYDDSVTSPTLYAAYQRLFNGENFLYGGRTIEYPGLIPIVVYYTLARYLQSSALNITKFGVVTKMNDQSQPVDRKIIEMEVADLRAQAISYGEIFKKYVLINIATFPLYGFKYSGQQVNQSGFPFF